MFRANLATFRRRSGKQVASNNFLFPDPLVVISLYSIGCLA